MAVLFVEVLFLLLAVQSCSCAVSHRRGSQRSSFSTTLATFNAALVPTYPEQDTRAAILAQEIRKSGIDIICLQELFRSDHQRILYDAVKDLYPYSASLIDLSPDIENLTPPCAPEDLAAFSQCVVTTCPQTTDVSCAILSCGPVFHSTSFECKFCIGLNFVTGIQVCVSEPSSRYELTYGLLMVSNRELKNISTGGYVGNVSESRGYLKASVDNVGDVTCTHLTTAVAIASEYIGPPLFSPPQFTTYAEQQYNELRQLLEIAVSSKVDTSILLGDFNHGPAVATSPGASEIGWSKPFHYGLVAARGFISPYLLYDGRCTFCSENPGTSFFSPPETSFIFDHIYIPTSAFFRLLSVRRLWDDITTPSGIPLSDHYGIKMTLRNIGTCIFPGSAFCSFNEGKNTFLSLPLPNQDLAGLCYAVNSD